MKRIIHNCNVEITMMPLGYAKYLILHRGKTIRGTVYTSEMSIALAHVEWIIEYGPNTRKELGLTDVEVKDESTQGPDRCIDQAS